MPIRGFIELLRRVALLAGLAAAVCAAFLTRFEPMVMVSLAAPGADAGSADSTAMAPGRRGSAEVLTVHGPAWDSLFAGVTRSFAGNFPIAGWEHRIPRRTLEEARKENASRGAMTEAQKADEADRVARLREKYGTDVSFTGSFSSLHFAAREAPFRDLLATWPPGTTRTLRVEGNAASLEVAYLPAYELHGFSDTITLPEAFSYPYRRWAPWLALAALLVYALLPWGRIPPEVVAYTRWRLILADVVSAGLLALPFFAMPIAIIGGTVQTAVEFLPFAAVFWLLALLGVAATFWAATAAAYRLTVLPDRLSVAGIGSAREVRFADVRNVQPVRLRPPRWLIAASWIAALMGSSKSATAGQVGRSLLIQTSAANGLRLDLANGTALYIWLSDQMGNTAVEHFGRLNEALRRDGIAWDETTEELRRLIPPTH